MEVPLSSRSAMGIQTHTSVIRVTVLVLFKVYPIIHGPMDAWIAILYACVGIESLLAHLTMKLAPVNIALNKGVVILYSLV